MLKVVTVCKGFFVGITLHPDDRNRNAYITGLETGARFFGGSSKELQTYKYPEDADLIPPELLLQIKAEDE